MQRVTALILAAYLATWSPAWCCCSIRSLLGAASVPGPGGCSSDGPLADAAAAGMASCPTCIAARNGSCCGEGEGDDDTVPRPRCRCHELDRAFARSEVSAAMALVACSLNLPHLQPWEAGAAAISPRPSWMVDRMPARRDHAPPRSLHSLRTLLLI
jgi:hypothetical protein